MAAREVTPERDARWSLQHARQEIYNAKLEVRRANMRLDRAVAREVAALNKLNELGVKE